MHICILNSSVTSSIWYALVFQSHNHNFHYMISRSKRCTTYILIYTPFPKSCFTVTNRKKHINVSCLDNTSDKIIKLPQGFGFLWYLYHGTWRRIWHSSYLRSFDKRHAIIIRRRKFQNQAGDAQNQKSIISSKLKKI